MKKLMILLSVTIPMVTLSAMAQVSPTPSPSASPLVGGAPESWLLDLVTKFPKIATLLFIVGGLRLTLKPFFSFLHQMLPAWGLVAWDQSVTAVEQSQPIKVLYFLLDYLGSVKMPVPQASSSVQPTQPPTSAA